MVRSEGSGSSRAYTPPLPNNIIGKALKRKYEHSHSRSRKAHHDRSLSTNNRKKLKVHKRAMSRHSCSPEKNRRSQGRHSRSLTRTSGTSTSTQSDQHKCYRSRRTNKRSTRRNYYDHSADDYGNLRTSKRAGSSVKRRCTETQRHHSSTPTSSSSTTTDSRRESNRRYRDRKRERSRKYSTERRSRHDDSISSYRKRRSRKSRHMRRKSKESPHQHKDLDTSLLEKIIDLMADKQQSNSSTLVGAQNVIPLFDPNSKAQTSKDWIRKVNEIASIYHWKETQIIYHALPKLSGLAKLWYEGLQTVDLSWEEWQELIMCTFPDDQNCGDKLAEMLDRKSRHEESLEEYYHDKMALVNRCRLTGRDAVDCIVHGIYDHNVRLNAQGSNFQRPQDLLKFLRNVSNKTINQTKRVMSNNNIRPSTSKTENSSALGSGLGDSNRYKFLKCFNCSEIGHSVARCPKPVKFCNRCKKVGHDQEQCWLGQNTGRDNNAKSSETQKKNNSKYS